MSDYTPTTDFSTKDSLPTGNPNKIIKGSDFDVEFVAIQSAFDSLDSASVSFTPAGTGASVTTVQSKLRETPTRADYDTEADYIAAAEALQTGGFWTDEATVGRIHRMSDRLFLDDAVQFSGDWSGVDNDYSPIPRWPSREASLLTWSSVGRNAIVGLSRTDLGLSSPGGTPTSADSAIGIIGIGINDYTGSDVRQGFGGYFESWKVSGCLNATFGVEIDVGNDTATSQTNTPYSPFGAGSFGLNIAAGGSKGSAYANPSSCAIVIANNGQSFNQGIVFAATAITGTDGVTGTGRAINFAKGHSIGWSIAGNITTTNLYSSVSDAAYKKTLEFHDLHSRFLGAGNNICLAIADTTSSVNYISISPNITTEAPVVSAVGGDTNIDLSLVSKGTGVIKFGTWTSNADAAVNGYITIKDSSGNARKLATIA